MTQSPEHALKGRAAAEHATNLVIDQIKAGERLPGQFLSAPQVSRAFGLNLQNAGLVLAGLQHEGYAVKDKRRRTVLQIPEPPKKPVQEYNIHEQLGYPYNEITNRTFQPIPARRLLPRQHIEHERITPDRLLTGTDLGPPEQYVVFVHPGAGAKDLRRRRVRGQSARRAGRLVEQLIASGMMSPIDAAVEGVAFMEDDINLIAGAGSGPNEKGIFEFDSFVANGNKFGAVGTLAENFSDDPQGSVVEHPVHVAKLVYNKKQVKRNGEGAYDLARENGLSIKTHHFFQQAYEQGMEFRHGILKPPKKRTNEQSKIQSDTCDTVGIMVAARYGGVWQIAAAGSTGGMPDKPWGREGDTATNGAGFRLKDDTGETRYEKSSSIQSRNGRYYRLYNHIAGALVSGLGEAALETLPAETWTAAQFNRSLSSDSAIERLGRTIFDKTNGWGAMITMGINRFTRSDEQVLFKDRISAACQEIELGMYSLVPHFPVAIFTNVPNATLKIMQGKEGKFGKVFKTRKVAVPMSRGAIELAA